VPILLLRSSAPPEFRTSFSTTFDGSEDPLSESGDWARTDANSTKVVKSSGVAIGTQTGNNGYDDSQAVVTGFDPAADIRVEATIFRSGSISSENHEVELLLRSTETSTTTKKYEFLFNKDSGFVFVKWLGGHGFDQFHDLGTDTGFDSIPSTANGTQIAAEVETLSATSVELRAYYKLVGEETWTLFATTVDDGSKNGAAYITGAPGVGFYITSPSANPAHFGFTAYSVTVI
jgi:hypothetical protein